MPGTGVIDLLTMVCALIGGIGVPLAAIMYLKVRKTALLELSANASLERVIENLDEGFYRTTLDGKHISVNPAMIAISGFNDETELVESIGHNFGGWYVAPGRRDEFKKILSEEGKVSNFVSEVLRDKTRERIWISENARLVLDPVTNKPSHYEGTVVEVTDVVMRIQEQERLKKLASQVPGGLFQLVRDPNGVFSVDFASSGFNQLLDLQVSSHVFDISHFLSLIHPEDMNDYNASLKRSRKSGRVWSHDFRVVTDGGKTKWLKVQATPESRPDMSTIWHGLLQDITAAKVDEAAIKSLAYHDALTKLPNRRALIERMEQKIAACQRRNEYAALLFIDVDTFKSLNDSHGHDAGDLLLIEIGSRLRHIVRRSDAVARLSGDEFVVLLDFVGATKAEAAKKAAAIAQKITASFANPFQLGMLTHRASASIGGITFNGDQSSVDAILRLADCAMYDVKKSGRNSYKIYDDEAEYKAIAQNSLLNGLAGITERDELELRLQPQFDRSGKICGAEALLCWNHPELGLLTHDKFMQYAEKSGQTAAINSWALNAAFLVLNKWLTLEEAAGWNLATKIGPQQFSNSGLPTELASLAKQHHVNLAKLTLELPEILVWKNYESSLQILKKLKYTGVKLLLDDFGVEQPSLSALADMPFSAIKIHRKFVASMLKSPQNRALVKSITAMVDALGFSTSAEHVETQAQEKLLLELGCSKFQGFLYGGALTQADFEKAFVHNLAEQDHRNSASIAA